MLHLSPEIVESLEYAKSNMFFGVLGLIVSVAAHFYLIKVGLEMLKIFRAF